MKSRELVKEAIRHRSTERVPYAIDLCSDAWEAIGKGVADKTAGKTVEEFLDNDIKDFACPWWDWYQLASDWTGPDVPISRATVIGTGSYSEFIDTLQKSRETSDKYFLIRIYGSHFEKAYFSRGIENFLADMAGQKDFARGLLNRIIEKNLVMLENILAHKEIDGILLGSDWGSQRDLLMSPGIWEEMIRPGEQKEYDLCHAYGKDVWVHSCGCIEPIIPSLIEMGLDVLNPIQPEAMDIGELKRKYGDKLTFWGGISTQQTLPYGTPEEVKKEARLVRNLMSRNGGYVFSPAQSIQADVPAENILALLEIAREKANQKD